MTMAKSCGGKKLKPFTPVRKLFVKLDQLRSAESLGGRRQQTNSNRRRNASRTEDSSKSGQAIPTRTDPSPQVPLRPVFSSSNPTRIALQNEDPTEDVVIITKLDSIPFCCHEDLLTMSRDQLVTVARCLNAKLPAAMQIDVSHGRLTTFIRHSIELVVGLRRKVPPAPKAVKLQSTSGLNALDFNMSPPTSPLTTRIRKHVTSPGNLRLARLDEKDEDLMVMDRPVKRRKLPALINDASAATKSPSTPTLPHRRLMRSRRHWITSSAPQKVLRSYRHTFPEMQDNERSGFPIPNISRLCYPPNVELDNLNSGATTFHQGSFLTARLTREVSFGTIYQDENNRANGSSPESSPARPTDRCGLKRRRSDAEAEEMTSGIGGMSMAVSGSAMEVCID